MVRRPPELAPSISLNPFQNILKTDSDNFVQYLDYYKPVDDKGRYLPYDEFYYRVKSSLMPELAWGLTRKLRNDQSAFVLHLGTENKKLPCRLMQTPAIQKALSFADRHTTTAVHEWMTNKIGEKQHFDYLMKDLSEDEAISSSQLEGAATTTFVAKDLLKRKRKPKTPDEKMIVGNFKMMNFVWEKRSAPLDIDLILQLHKVGTEGIDDNSYCPGAFRRSDDVVVADAEGNIVYTPPLAADLEKRLKVIIEWANTCHDDAEGSEYIHPMIKAICLHFAIGFEHPFKDGNGRVARSLFYWYMFKNEYSAFRYITISKLLKSAPVQYGKSYLYTETDNMDLTYFIDYQCRIIIRAIQDFKLTYKKSVRDIREFDEFIFRSGLYKRLSEKQRVVFHVAKSKIAKYFTISNVSDNLGCSYNTASKVLNGLVEENLFKKEKNKKEWIYSMRAKDEILTQWN